MAMNADTDIQQNITKYTIYGERCSGTNYIDQLMAANFVLELTEKYGHKHFFGFYDFDNLPSDATKNEINETLFICIVRNPIAWLDSLYKNPHHLPESLKETMQHFLTLPFYSVDEAGNRMANDTNFIKGDDKYKNVFEMRFVKNYYLLNVLPQKVRNCVMLNYEIVRDNTFGVLEMLQKRFNLTPKVPMFVNIKFYKDVVDKEYKRQPITMSRPFIAMCARRINKQQEARLGYPLSH
jgi:hypothetical protein